MAKRFSATEIWDEDWFLDMPNEYKLFWFYMLSSCDHAGFFKVNIRSFCAMNGVKIDTEKALKFFNHEKERLRILKNGFWFIEDFIHFQYGGRLNRSNKAHVSVLKLLEKFCINVLGVRGVRGVFEGSGTAEREVSDEYR